MNTLYAPVRTLNFRGRLMDLRQPRVMGILNMTPDSFYYGSRTTPADVVEVAEAMLNEGTDFLDVGGYSSRPGAADVPVEEELARTIPVIQALRNAFPKAIISIDTFRSLVAHQALDAGADWVNDISGGQLDADMLTVVGKAKVPYLMMHMRGTPQTMKQQTQYDNLLKEVTGFFLERIEAAKQAGIHDLIIDPGFGFAKTAEQNFYLLRHLKHLEILGLPILAGVSRKSMIWNSLQIAPDEALNGTTALNMIALVRGASILRVHDVREAKQCIQLYRQVYKN